MGADDYYAVLGVSRAENLQGIQTAYRKLAKQCHPDRAGIEGKERFQAIQEAYEVLSDPDKRKEYDADVDRRRRMRGTGSIKPEPFVPSHYPSRFSGPEPLVRPAVPPEDIVAPASSHCAFCDGLRNRIGVPCPFCRQLEPLEHDMTQFITTFLRAFRMRPF